MLSILELPTVRQRVARISVESYHAMSAQGLLDERTELLRGAIVEKMTKSPLHASVVRELFRMVSSRLRPGMVAQKEDPLTLVDSEPEPDIAVVEGRPDGYRAGHPRAALLVMEVAVRTEETDREKASIYAEAGVAEYWLVLPEKGVIEIFTQPMAGKYGETRIVRRGEVAVSPLLPELRVDVGGLFG
jgi:Uma2 family endonuclease